VTTASETRDIRGDGRTSGPLRVTIGRHAEIQTLKSELSDLIEAGADEADVDAYIAASGITPQELQAQGVAPVSTVDVPASEKQGGIADLPATISKGLLKGATFLPDLAARGIGALGGYAADALGYPGAAEQLRNPATIGGTLDSIQPTYANQEWADSLGQGIGAAASGVGIGRAMAAVPEMFGGGQVLQGVGGMLAQQPGLQAVAGGTSALAGAGAVAAGAGPVGQTAAALAGGILPFGAIGTVEQLGRATLAPTTGAGVRDAASQLIKQSAVDPAAAASAIRAQPAVTIPGVLPTTAEVAGDAGLAALQRGMTNTSVNGGGAMHDRMVANMSARSTAIQGAASTGNPDALRSAANTTGDALEAGTRGAIGRVGPLKPADVSGEALRDQLAASAKAAKARVKAKYDAVPVDEDPIQIGAVEPNRVSDLGAGPIDQGRINFETEGRAATGGSLSRAGYSTGGKPQGTLLGWIRKQGGLVTGGDRGDLAAAGITPKSMPGLFNNNRGSFTKGAARSNTGMFGNRIDDLRGSMVEDGWLPEGATIDDAVQLIADDFRGSATKGAHRVQRVRGDVQASNGANADDISNYWGKELQDRGLDPKVMNSEDWDHFYRDMGGPALPISHDDAAFLSTAADNAAGRAELSPFQASLLTLRRLFFPGAGLPADGSVSHLMRQLENADVLSAPQVERIVSDLRSQAGHLRMTDPRSGALAKAAADATEGLLLSQAGPARAAALKEARAAYRDYKATYGEGEVGKILGTNAYGRAKLDAARVPATAVPGNVEGRTATRRLTMAAGPEAAQQAAREELRRALESAGTDRARITAVQSRYASVLAEHPSLAADVKKASEAAALAETFARSPLGMLRNGSASPLEAVAQAMRAKDGGETLRAISAAVRSNPEAQSGLRRALAAHILPDDMKGTMTLSGDVVAPAGRTMERLSDVLTKTKGTSLFTAQQRGIMIETLRQLKALKFANSAARPLGSDTARNAAIAGKVAHRSIAPGVSHGFKVIDMIIGAYHKTDQIGELVREAMLDPKLAANLLEHATPRRVEIMRNRTASLGGGASMGLGAIHAPQGARMLGGPSLGAAAAQGKKDQE
jgi:hypothetical protein